MKEFHMVAFILVVVGAVNWGLVGLFQYDLIASLLGGLGLVNIFNILAGLSAVYIGATHMKDCKICSAK